MLKYRIYFTTSDGRNARRKKFHPFSRSTDEEAKKVYDDFTHQANSDGQGPSVHPEKLVRIEVDGDEADITPRSSQPLMLNEC